MENDPKTGFRLHPALPPAEVMGSSLGVFVPHDTLHMLHKLTPDEHKFLQSLLERLSDDLQALQGAETAEDIERMMSTVGSELSSATKLKSLETAEAYDLVINMVSAVAASGIRCLFLDLLHKVNQPEEKDDK